MKNLCRTHMKDKRVLIKGDSGIGKTRLAKIIAWDWANETLARFTLVFLVSLNITDPSDTIKCTILKQYPIMQGLNISQEKIRYIFKLLGNRCLLILDGLDEFKHSTNSDVYKIIRGHKLLQCNVICTTRSHGTRQIEHYFQDVVKIKVFTESQAKKFVSKLLLRNVYHKEKIENKADAVVQFLCLQVLCFSSSYVFL